VRVIDSSALVKYFSREENWEKIRDLMQEGVITLDLAIKEIANSLWKKVIKGEMDSNIALKILRDLIEEKPIIIEDQNKYLQEAFILAIRYKITIYDALFISLAKNLNKELITCDGVQAKVASQNNVRVLFVK
jgi:predicted nucleic acid-binding protein